MKSYLILLILGIFLFSCEKNNQLNINAEIISFNPDKCSCCWGWLIKTGNDTIKSDDEIIGSVIGYEIINPIKVKIELGEKKQSCSGMENFKGYYNIIKIEKVEN